MITHENRTKHPPATEAAMTVVRLWEGWYGAAISVAVVVAPGSTAVETDVAVEVN